MNQWTILQMVVIIEKSLDRSSSDLQHHSEALDAVRGPRSPAIWPYDQGLPDMTFTALTITHNPTEHLSLMAPPWVKNTWL